MIRLLSLVPVALAPGLVPLALAQTTPAGSPPAPVAAPAQAASAATSATAAGREIDHRVIEDEGVRIEELRVRGQPRSIVVQSKLGGVRSYEIVVGRGGRDPSQDKSAAGLPSWSLLRF